MRKRKTGKIDNKEYTVLEVRVQDILDILGLAEDKGAGKKDAGTSDELTDLWKKFNKYLPRFVEGIKVNDMIKMAPSEIEQIYDDFREVNSTFFSLAQRLKLGEILEKLKDAIIADFSAIFADFSKQVTGSPGSTDIPSS